jgi:serine/alanine adding enzyme
VSASSGLVADGSADQWNEFVRSRSEASAYHGYEWRQVVRRVFGCESYYLACWDHEDVQSGTRRITGVLPLARLKSALFGDYLVSLPFFNYGGVVAESARESQLLFGAAVDLAKRLGVSHMELRHEANVFPDAPQRSDKVTMILPLPATADALWKSLPSKVRAQVRRPEREGATVDSGGRELVEDFYRVFAENMRDLGTPVYARRFFDTMLQTFPDRTRIFVVRLAGKPVAAGFVLGHAGTLEIPWASSLRHANALGVNMLLYWRILQYACESAYACFDFGRCTADSGTYRFKKQWGAQSRQLHWHYWLRSGDKVPVINHSNPKYRLAIATWQKLPLAVANLLGPMLSRSLP